jgi:hypothetical protein
MRKRNKEGGRFLHTALRLASPFPSQQFERNRWAPSQRTHRKWSSNQHSRVASKGWLTTEMHTICVRRPLSPLTYTLCSLAHTRESRVIAGGFWPFFTSLSALHFPSSFRLVGLPGADLRHRNFGPPRFSAPVVVFSLAWLTSSMNRDEGRKWALSPIWHSTLGILRLRAKRGGLQIWKTRSFLAQKDGGKYFLYIGQGELGTFLG